jgi:ribosomal silencing factor RsfS
MSAQSLSSLMHSAIMATFFSERHAEAQISQVEAQSNKFFIKTLWS